MVVNLHGDYENRQAVFILHTLTLGYFPSFASTSPLSFLPFHASPLEVNPLPFLHHLRSMSPIVARASV